MTVSLVTGANSGIGRATAARLAREGHHVFAGMRDTGKADKLRALAGDAADAVTPIDLDVTSDQSVAAAFAVSGPVDVLVNNAGVGYNATAEDIDIAAGMAAFDVNYWGIVRCLKAAVPAMRERGSGHIVNISSVAGRIAAIGQTVYSSSKWAVEALSESLAQELVAFGISVSIIEPGVTRTAILPKNLDVPQPTAYQAAYERMLTFYAAGIEAEVPPEDVADVVWHALTTDQPQLRYPCAWGGRELIEGRAELSDADWVALGRLDNDAYYRRFAEVFGLELDAGSG